MVGFGGDHTGSNMYENTVTSAANLVSIGLMVSDHPWSNAVWGDLFMLGPYQGIQSTARSRSCGWKAYNREPLQATRFKIAKALRRFLGVA
jgi:hypothetical protein